MPTARRLSQSLNYLFRETRMSLVSRFGRFGSRAENGQERSVLRGKDNNLSTGYLDASVWESCDSRVRHNWCRLRRVDAFFQVRLITGNMPLDDGDGSGFAVGTLFR